MTHHQADAGRQPLHVHIEDVQWEQEGAIHPRVELSLLRSQYPPDPAHAFMPQRLPDRCALKAVGPLDQVLRRGSVSFVARLRPGTYDVPLGQGPACQLTVEPDARCRGRVVLDAAGMGGSPVVKLVDLVFTPALSIGNVLQTLGQLHELVADRRLAPLRGIYQATLAPRLPGWLREAADNALGTADMAAEILLERASAQVRLKAEPTLPFAFSGRVRWVDQVETRFEELKLPGPVLPIPFAAVEKLLLGTPLASAIVVGEAPQGYQLARAVLDTIEHVEAELALELRPPAVLVKGRTIDGVDVTTDVAASAPLELHGAVTAEVNGSQISVSAADLQLSEPGRAEDDRTELHADLSAELELDLDAEAERPLADRVTATLTAALRPGSRVRALDLELRTRETLTMGEADLPLRLSDVHLAGGVSASWRDGGLEARPGEELTLRGRLRSSRPAQLRDARQEATLELEATLAGRLTPQTLTRWGVSGDLDATFVTRLQNTIEAIPELDIDEGVLTSELAGRLDAHLVCDLELLPGHAFAADLAGTRFGLALDRGELNIARRRVCIPEGTELRGRMQGGVLRACGPEQLALDLAWDLHGRRCLLHHQDQAISLLTPDLRAGQVTLTLDRTGRIQFSGDRSGLYGVRYFNALLNPMSDPEELFDLLRSDDAINRVVAAVGAFAPRLAEALTDLRAMTLGARYILQQEGIEEPRHLIPRAAICRTLSLLLTGTDELVSRLEPIVKQVTDGQGLDRAATRVLMQQQLGEFDVDYEIGAAVKWLDLVLSPTEPVAPPPCHRAPPLALDPELAAARQGLPSAAEIYAAVARGAPGETWSKQLATLAPRLSRPQLRHLLDRADAAWDPALVARLTYVHEVKERVADIAEGYGGAEYGLQPLIIGSFVAEAVGPLPAVNPAAGEGEWPPPCALGPEDVAVLLLAGQSAGREDKRTQLNNRMLMELLRREPEQTTLAVFVELGDQNPRALTGILYAFLDQDQDQLTNELDLPELLSRKLDLPVPRQRDFMAGGRRAKDSYYEALSQLADEIIAASRPYLAAKQHLQVVRHEPPPALVLPATAEQLERRAQQSIARADDWGQRCDFRADQRGGPRAKAREAYRRAFRACARLIEREPRAFTLPWLSDFWRRNEEALTLLSVVRGQQQHRDSDRRWLEVTTGQPVPDGEQRLLETVVQALYWRPDHCAAMLADPLARLLIDPEPGRYRFSIVSCMGVITDGEAGNELEDAYGRLERDRGVQLVRANTGLSRSLEYNADRIIEAIAACDSPWGIIGYSQGCANALMAESTLLGGTPEQQRLLDTMVSRKMLFSAANGSAHGSSGMLKFHRALVHGERYLKHYQATLSWQAIKNLLKIAKLVLDSRVFVHVLGGVHSLTYERAIELHRDGQFLAHVPTSRTCGVVAERIVPEALEFLYHVLNVITHHGDHDTQVLIEDAVGGSTRVTNAQTEVLSRCDMGAFPQKTHHWSPLTREIEFVTTEQDLERATYQSPKDRHVWPWVEVNARFGRIERES